MTSQIPPNTVLVIAGPTGVGKTALSLKIADNFPVEIISADSRQIYRLMDIGTAKPSQEIRDKIPHHFVDILNPDQDYNAGEFATAARKKLQEIFAKGKLPIVVGGSGLYIRALLEGFFVGRAKDPQIRKKLNARLEKEGVENLYSELREIDPEAAQKIHPNNTKRVIRSLEVYLVTGKPMSKIQKENPDPASFKSIKICLTMDRAQLYSRLDQRVDEMFQDGLVEEVRQIIADGYAPTSNSLNSVGYSEVISYLNNEITLEVCQDLVKRNTRRYAKRQLTWFRREKSFTWMEKKPLDQLSRTICTMLKNPDEVTS